MTKWNCVKLDALKFAIRVWWYLLIMQHLRIWGHPELCREFRGSLRYIGEILLLSLRPLPYKERNLTLLKRIRMSFLTEFVSSLTAVCNAPWRPFTGIILQEQNAVWVPEGTDACSCQGARSSSWVCSWFLFWLCCVSCHFPQNCFLCLFFCAFSY